MRSHDEWLGKQWSDGRAGGKAGINTKTTGGGGGGGPLLKYVDGTPERVAVE